MPYLVQHHATGIEYLKCVTVRTESVWRLREEHGKIFVSQWCGWRVWTGRKMREELREVIQEFPKAGPDSVSHQVSLK